ncbi:MAG: VOC family protein [Microbacteriaceae bacterium]
METELLDPGTAMGAVTLRVGDLDTMIAYYRDAVTLDLLSQDGSSAVLGTGSTAAVVLQHAPELHSAEPRQAGLFHTAIVFDTRTRLAAAIYSVARKFPGTFTGSADHLVSQAFYFTDPEGNGVELYWDRARDAWSWTHGRVEMATMYLDPNAFLNEHLTPEAATDPRFGSGAVGHVHLAVGDVASARQFYVNQLGFETTAELGGSALFVSAGGYHHHMAMNTWNSAGAGRRRRSLGLGQIEIVVPTPDAVGEVAERLTHYGIATRDDGVAVSFDDPWANGIRLISAGREAVR